MNKEEELTIVCVVESHRRGNIFGQNNLEHYMRTPGGRERSVCENLCGDIGAGVAHHGNQDPDWGIMFRSTSYSRHNIEAYGKLCGIKTKR